MLDVHLHSCSGTRDNQPLQYGPQFKVQSEDLNKKLKGRFFTACESSYDLDEQSRRPWKQPKIALYSYENFYDEVDLQMTSEKIINMILRVFNL